MQKKFIDHGFGVYVVNDDANTLIVNNAINVSTYHPKFILIGEDIDLLVLVSLMQYLNNIYFLKLGSGKIEKQLYNTECLQTVDATIKT